MTTKLKKFKVEYHNNNSGGYYWIGEEEFRILEAHGWTLTKRVAMESGQYYAQKTFRAIDEKHAHRNAIKDWSKILPRENANANGCACCGEPHQFRVKDKDG